MAKKVQTRTASKQVPLWKSPSPFKIYFDTTNYILLALGIVALIVGFVLLSQKPWDSTPSLVFSPIILVAAYVIILPASILYRKKKQTPKESEES